MATTVIIPVRNEQDTIRKIVETFNQHPETKGNVRVAIDAETTDDTLAQVIEADGIPLSFAETTGKGQIVRGTVDFLVMADRITPRIILCDGDYIGLTLDHIDRILWGQSGMVIGVPDWPEFDVPDHVTNSWPHVSGFRCLPWTLVPTNAHGYLLETQLNYASIADRMRIGHVMMPGLKSPFQWPLSGKRMAELERDRGWGRENGIL
jgi:hypothetical protein